jgi:hypothetical protein
MLRVWIKNDRGLFLLSGTTIVKQVAMNVDLFVLLHNPDRSYFGDHDDQADVLWNGSREQCLAKLNVVAEHLGKLFFYDGSSTEYVIDLTIEELNQ